VVFNEIELVLERKSYDISEILEKNVIDGEIRKP
jgi:hypothetical protein